MPQISPGAIVRFRYQPTTGARYRYLTGQVQEAGPGRLAVWCAGDRHTYHVAPSAIIAVLTP
jgi:hypothetical protein